MTAFYVTSRKQPRRPLNLFGESRGFLEPPPPPLAFEILAGDFSKQLSMLGSDAALIRRFSRGFADKADQRGFFLETSWISQLVV